MKTRLLTLILAALTAAAAMADGAADDDFCLWTSVGVQRRLAQRWSAGAEVEWRLADGWSATERLTAGLGAAYKPVRWLKFDAGYKFIRQQTADRTTYKERSGVTLVNNVYPAYWLTKHRMYVGATGTWRTGRLSLSLRERYQLTVRPEHDVDYYDVDATTIGTLADYDMKTKTKATKTKGVLRSRLMAEYRLPKRTGLTPYASAEMYTAGGIDKMRYTAGIEWKAGRHSVVDLGYRYQAILGGNDDDPDTNALLVGYKFKF